MTLFIINTLLIVVAIKKYIPMKLCVHIWTNRRFLEKYFPLILFSFLLNLLSYTLFSAPFSSSVLPFNPFPWYPCFQFTQEILSLLFSYLNRHHRCTKINFQKQDHLKLKCDKVYDSPFSSYIPKGCIKLLRERKILILPIFFYIWVYQRIFPAMQ